MKPIGKAPITRSYRNHFTLSRHNSFADPARRISRVFLRRTDSTIFWGVVSFRVYTV